MDMSFDDELGMINEMHQRRRNLEELLVKQFDQHDIFPNYGLLMGSKRALLPVLAKILSHM